MRTRFHSTNYSISSQGCSSGDDSYSRLNRRNRKKMELQKFFVIRIVATAAAENLCGTDTANSEHCYLTV